MPHPVPVTARLALMLALLSCGGRDVEPLPEAQNPEPRDQPPVPLDANPPVEYPPDLYSQGVSGTVVLRLFVDEQGTVVPDSIRVEESSGNPTLDSAALAAAPQLRYAPALRAGKAVAAPFRQPFHFRHPSGSTLPP